MFKNNIETFFEIWDGYKQSYIFKGNEKELIKEIAKYWRENYVWPEDMPRLPRVRFYNSFIENSCCSPKDPGDKRYQIFDNYGRIIQPRDYEQLSFNYWRYSTGQKLYHRYNWHRNIHYTFRRGPVPYIHKWRGGPSQRMQKTKHILLLYDDPFYKKEFSRGSRNMIPQCWDDKFKERDIKNWKHQSKCRHQWQRGEKDHWLGQ